MGRKKKRGKRNLTGVLRDHARIHVLRSWGAGRKGDVHLTPVTLTSSFTMVRRRSARSLQTAHSPARSDSVRATVPNLQVVVSIRRRKMRCQEPCLHQRSDKYRWYSVPSVMVEREALPGLSTSAVSNENAYGTAGRSLRKARRISAHSYSTGPGVRRAFRSRTTIRLHICSIDILQREGGIIDGSTIRQHDDVTKRKVVMPVENDAAGRSPRSSPSLPRQMIMAAVLLRTTLRFSASCRLPKETKND